MQYIINLTMERKKHTSVGYIYNHEIYIIIFYLSFNKPLTHLVCTFNLNIS